MRWPKFKTCCCGCTLRDGCLILGWLGTVGVLIDIIVAIWFFITPADKLGPGLYGEYIKDLAGWILFLATFGLFFYLTLLVGTYKENAKYLSVSLISGIILYAINLLGVIVQMVIYEFLRGPLLAMFIFGLLFGGYILLIIRSHWLDIKEGKTQSTNYAV